MVNEGRFYIDETQGSFTLYLKGKEVKVMDESFQAMMPLENASPVYSIVYGENTQQVQQQGAGQLSFMQFLLSELNMILQPTAMQDQNATIPFEMSQFSDQMELANMELPVEELTGDFIDGTFPFLPITGGDGIMFPFISQDSLPEGAFAPEQLQFAGVGGQLANEQGVPTLVVPQFTQDGVLTLVSAFAAENGNGEANNVSVTSFFEDQILQTSQQQGANGSVVQSNHAEQFLQMIEEAVPQIFEAKSQEGVVMPQFEKLFGSIFEEGAILDDSSKARVDNTAFDVKTYLSENLFQSMTDSLVLTEAQQGSNLLSQFPREQFEVLKMNELKTDSSNSQEPLLQSMPTAQELFDANVAQSFEDSSFEGRQEQLQTPLQQTGETQQSDVVGEHTNNVRFESTLQERIQQAEEAKAVSQQIVRATLMRQGDQFAEFVVKLEPEYLGALRMSVTMDNDTLVAKITADNTHTRSLLTSNLSTLKDALDEAGINLDDIEIDMHEEGDGFQNSHDENEFTRNKKSFSGNEFQDPFNLFELEKELEGSLLREDTTDKVQEQHVDFFI